MVDRLPPTIRPTGPPPITVRSLILAIYVPVIVFEIGHGAIAPIIALTALDLGASARTAGFMLALLGIGMILGYLPAGMLTNRLGDRNAMIVSSGVAIVALAGCIVAPSTLLLAAALFLLGLCNSTYYLARQSYITVVTPAHLRGRAISTLGGSHRIGLLIGPFVGAGSITLLGLRAAYVVAIIAVAAAAVVLWLVPDVSHAEHRERTRPAHNTLGILIRHRRMFLTLGMAAMAGNAVRATRQMVLPLWGDHIGLTPEVTSVVFGIATAMDVVMFYPGGRIMDRYGRLAVALPSMFLLAATTMAIPLTNSMATMTIVAMVMGLGNGIGSGLFQTLGADLAPPGSRVPFLSLWRVMTDSGSAGGPMLVSVVASAWTLTAGIVAVGTIGLFSAAGLARWTPRYSGYATRAMVRQRRAETAVNQPS